MNRKLATFLGLPVVIAGVALGGLATGAHAASVTSSATTQLTQRPDSGYGGNNWALDKMTRVSSVTLNSDQSGVQLTDCGAAAQSCYAYTGTISDTGTAYATDGQTSPGADAVPIANEPAAAITGSAALTFYASTNDPSMEKPPASLAGAGNAEQSTTNWVEQFFPEGTTFGAGPAYDDGGNDWAWTYKDTRDCQQWVDEGEGSSDTKATSGDITGADSCTISVTDPGNQTVTADQPASIQVFGATTSSNQALTYAVTSGTLPGGLSLDPSTGIISGTPKANATGGTIQVTVTDFGGKTAATSFGITVNPAVGGPGPSKTPVLSHGSAVSVSGTRETVNWDSTVEPGTWQVTITGPGPIDGRVNMVKNPQAVYAGLEAGHHYSVAVQQFVNGKASGNPGRVTFLTK